MYYGYGYGYDSMYFLVLLAFIFSMVAQMKVSGTFKKYAKIRNRRGLTGAQVAEQMMHNAGIYDVSVQRVAGNLTDHYDPRTKTLRLSESVYDSTSVAAVGVAAHETGHAIQHDVGYAPLALRSFFVPLANFGSRLAIPLILIGFIFSGGGSTLVTLGILFFSLSVVFTIITLPVEFNASRRAIRLLADDGFLDSDEIGGAKKVLSAAAMTYVAALLVARRNRKAITMEDIEEASMKVMAGPEKKSRVVTPEEKKLTAYHEAGHAVAGFYCKHHPRVHEITIIPRGQAGGYTMYLPEKDRSYVTKGEMFEDIVSSLGGRVAEQLILEDISTGASNDLQQATNIARQMITKYGFSERLGPVVYGTSQEETFLGRDLGQGKGYSETTAAEIDSEMRDIIDEAYETCRRTLTEHIDQLHALAQALMEREKLNEKEFNAVMAGETLPQREDPDAKPAEAQPAVQPVEQAETAEVAEPAEAAEAVDAAPQEAPAPETPDEGEANQ